MIKESEKGFSLLEIVTLVGILALLFVIMMEVFINYGRIVNRDTQKAIIHSQYSFIADEIGENLRMAAAILPSRNMNGTTYSSGSDAIVIKIPSIDANGSVIEDTWDYAVFYIDSAETNKLFYGLQPDPLSSRPAANRLLSDKISFFKFTYNNSAPEDADSVALQMRIAKTVSGHEHYVDFHSLFDLINI